LALTASSSMSRITGSATPRKSTSKATPSGQSVSVPPASWTAAICSVAVKSPDFRAFPRFFALSRNEEGEGADGNVPAGCGNARMIEKAVAALPGTFDKIYVRGNSALYEHEAMTFMDERAIA
jgi:hypothetical protein